jgi:uncharacterized protein (DUF885 family)
MSKRFFALCLAAAALLAVACGSGERSLIPNVLSREAALKRALFAYSVEFLRRFPTTNTYLGGAGLDPKLRDVDGTLRDYSPASLEAEDSWLTGVEKTLVGIPAGTLSAPARIDHDVALAQVRFMLHQHQGRRYQERALDTYASEPFRALDWQLQGMTPTGADTYGTADEWAMVVRRVKAIPQFLTTAQEQLLTGVSAIHAPDRRMLQRDGLDTSQANAKYFGETLSRLAESRITGGNKEQLVAELHQAGKEASDAYAKFREFVAATFFSHGVVKSAFAGDRFAMGEQEYNWAVRNNLNITATAAELYDGAWPIVEATQQSMIVLAREIGEHHNWKLPSEGPAAVRAVFDELSKDYPKSDEEMVGWYRDTAVRLVDFSRKTGLFEMPTDYKLEVVETPPPLQASIDGAAYYPAPPFKRTGIGRFYVTPTHNDKAALQSNNRASLADLAAHEGFPGHDWYYKILSQSYDQFSPVRWLTPGAVEDSSSMWEDSMAAEGWGLYAEALMAEPQPGAPNGFYTPEERLYQLQGELYRDLRVRIDTGIHTGRMRYDEAVDLFSQIVDFLPGACGASGKSDAKRASCESAERAIFRYSKWPTQAITYRLGKDQIYAMRADAAKRLGEKFSVKTFHLQYIKQGTIPANYFRYALLKNLQQAQ